MTIIFQYSYKDIYKKGLFMAHLTGNSGEQLRSGRLNYIKISIVVVHVLCLASLLVWLVLSGDKDGLWHVSANTVFTTRNLRGETILLFQRSMESLS